jgi:hypothetical protein
MKVPMQQLLLHLGQIIPNKLQELQEHWNQPQLWQAEENVLQQL